MSETNQQYFDATAYFQSKIDAICSALDVDEYSVTAERKIDAVNARVIVVAAMAGPVGAKSASITYEVSAHTNNPPEVMSILTELAMAETNKPFTSAVEKADGNTVFYRIIPSFMTPTIMDRDVEIGANHGVRIVQYASFGIIADAYDVESIEYKGDEVEFAQATISFVSQLSSNNKSGENLMKNASTGAAFSLSLTLPSQRNALVTDIIKVMVGSKGKNTPFDIKIGIGGENGFEMEKTLILSTATLNSVLGRVPSLQASFAEFDD